jgi:hypothetical protein
MNRKQLALSAALIVLIAVDAYAVNLYGLVGFFRMVFANFASVSTLVDLIIALVLILEWMSDDARERGVSALPFVLLMIALGSIGPLLYLIRRFSDRPDRAGSGAAQALRN